MWGFNRNSMCEGGRSNFSIIGFNKRCMGGFLDPYHKPVSTMFCAFMRVLRGKLRITKNTGQYQQMTT